MLLVKVSNSVHLGGQVAPTLETSAYLKRQKPLESDHHKPSDDTNLSSAVFSSPLLSVTYPSVILSVLLELWEIVTRQEPQKRN